eukprot:Gb_00400 [translate_table: standard]
MGSSGSLSKLLDKYRSFNDLGQCCTGGIDSYWQAQATRIKLTLGIRSRRFIDKNLDLEVLSGSQYVCSRDSRGSEGFPVKKACTVIKKKKGEVKMIRGEDVRMDRILKFLGKVLLGVWLIAKILVKVDVSSGLPKNIEITPGSYSYYHVLDYMKILFRYVRCHMHGHVVQDFVKPFKSKVWKKKEKGGILNLEEVNLGEVGKDMPLEQVVMVQVSKGGLERIGVKNSSLEDLKDEKRLDLAFNDIGVPSKIKELMAICDASSLVLDVKAQANVGKDSPSPLTGHKNNSLDSQSVEASKSLNSYDSVLGGSSSGGDYDSSVNVIVGGNLNFTLGRVEIWGASTRIDRMVDFFRNKIGNPGDHSWIGSGGGFHHIPIFIQLEAQNEKPTSPFKINPMWFNEEEFLDLVKKEWVGFDYRARESANIWGDKYGIFQDEVKSRLLTPEKKKTKLLEWREVEWILKCRALWIEKGDENTIFFHNYAKYRKRVNSIWEMQKEEGETVRSFPDLAPMGVNHFKSIYKELERANIAEILKLTSFFPSFLSEEDNELMMEEVSKEELKTVIASFKKDKSPDSLRRGHIRMRDEEDSLAWDYNKLGGRVIDESISHLLSVCPFTQHVWKEVEALTSIGNVWKAETIEACLKYWVNNLGLKELRALHCVICWGIWLARNSAIFEGNLIPPFQIIFQVGAMLSSIRVVGNPIVP